MKTKTLNAIQKSLINSLAIDDKDTSINYHVSDIDNNSDYAYSLDELDQIYKEDPEYVFKANTINCISLIMGDNSEIPLRDFKHQEDIKFLKISNDILKQANCEILMSVDKFVNYYDGIDDDMQWQIGLSCSILNRGFNSGEDIINDLNGYQNCKDLLNIADKNSNKYDLPIIRACMERFANLGNHQYQGYLPAIGQLLIMSKYSDLLYYVIDEITEGYGFKVNEGQWWSSSERLNAAYELNGANGYRLSLKNNNWIVLILFKKIK